VRRRVPSPGFFNLPNSWQTSELIKPKRIDFAFDRARAAARGESSRDMLPAMNPSDAVAKINEVLEKPSSETGGGIRAVVELANRYHACISNYSPPGSVFRIEADLYISQHPLRVHNKHVWRHEALRGVLNALRDAISNGSLSTFEELVRATVYSDLLEQGEALARQHYYRAAAVVVGAAFEDHVRKQATKMDIPLIANSRPVEVSALLVSLKKANVFSETVRTLAEGWTKVRNDAAHGNPGFEGADTSLVTPLKNMIPGVKGFISQYPVTAVGETQA